MPFEKKEGFFILIYCFMMIGVLYLYLSHFQSLIASEKTF